MGHFPQAGRRPGFRCLSLLACVRVRVISVRRAGPQLVQMFIGDGATIVRDAFVLAKEMLELSL